METLRCLAAPIELDIERLRPPSRPLRSLDEKIITELSASIRAMGLLQPIVAREIGVGFEVVFGCHRLEACRRLGMVSVPVSLCQMSDSEAFLARVTENLVRNNYVNPIEEAEGYRLLVNTGWTINAIARKIGKCDSYVSERLGVLDRLDQSLHSRISDRKGRLSPSHAELIARIADPSRQRELAEFVERKGLSVRTLESILKRAPLPTRVSIRKQLGEYSVVIPSEFMDSLEFKSSESLQMYVRGRRLILEKVPHSSRS